MSVDNGGYQGLPPVSKGILEFLGEGLVPELSSLVVRSDQAWHRIGEERNLLSSRNPGLAQLVTGSVDGLFEAVDEYLDDEQARDFVRIFGYFNAILLLRALDLAWRAEKHL